MKKCQLKLRGGSRRREADEAQNKCNSLTSVKLAGPATWKNTFHNQLKLLLQQTLFVEQRHKEWLSKKHTDNVKAFSPRERAHFHRKHCMEVQTPKKNTLVAKVDCFSSFKARHAAF